MVSQCAAAAWQGDGAQQGVCRAHPSCLTEQDEPVLCAGCSCWVLRALCLQLTRRYVCLWSVFRTFVCMELCMEPYNHTSPSVFSLSQLSIRSDRTLPARALSCLPLCHSLYLGIFAFLQIGPSTNKQWSNRSFYYFFIGLQLNKALVCALFSAF